MPVCPGAVSWSAGDYAVDPDGRRQDNGGMQGEQPKIGTRWWRVALVDGPILLVLILFFLLLKSYGFNLASGDENIYFYDAFLWSEGVWPYRDFFFAHPPLHLLPGWLLLLITGEFDLETVKMLPVAAAVISGICVYLITRRAGGTISAVLACVLLFFSHDFLRASTHWTGINWAVAWLSGGLLAALAGRGVLAGVLLGLGMTTGVYAGPGAIIITVLLFLARPKLGLWCGIAAFGTWAVVSGAFWLVGGDGYIDQVYRYHFLKPPAQGRGFADVLPRLLFHNFFVLAAPLLLLPVLVVRAFGVLGRYNYRIRWRSFLDPTHYPVLGTGIWCVALASGYLCFLGLLSRIFDYYSLLLFPAGAVCGGLYLSRLVSNTIEARRNKPAAVGAVLMSVPLIVGFLAYPRFEHELKYFAANQGKSKTYASPRSHLPEVLDASLKRLLWNKTRVIGNRYSGIQFYLWHESRRFTTARDMADVLGRNAREGETLWGDSASAPLLSLLSGVPLVDHFVDTNGMRFECGMPSAKDAVAQLEAALAREEEPLVWLILRPGRGVASRTKPMFEPLRKFYDKYFRTFQVFQDPNQGEFRLLVRKDRR